MKKSFISILLLSLALSIGACGKDEPKDVATPDIIIEESFEEVTITEEPSTEETIPEEPQEPEIPVIKINAVVAVSAKKNALMTSKNASYAADAPYTVQTMQERYAARNTP